MLGLGLSLAKQAIKVFSYVKDALKAYYRFYDTQPDFLLDGSTSFDGTDDYIDLPMAFSNTNHTISGWFKLDNVSGNRTLFCGRDGNDDGIRVLLNTSQVLYQINVSDEASGTGSISANEWTHVACTYDGTTQSIYLNGSLSASQSISRTVSTTQTAKIGRTAYGTSDYMLGMLANIGLWDRALSASEIESIYWRGSYSELQNTELTNLVSWYDLQGDVLDKQGSNDGTNNGTTLNSDSYSGESPFKPRIQDKAHPKMAVQLADGSTSFDGTDDYIEIQDDDTLDLTGDWTISLWLNPTALTSVDGIMGKRTPTEVDGNWILFYYLNKIQFWKHTGSTWQKLESTINPTVGEWKHIAITHTSSGTVTSIYDNGSLNATTTSITDIVATSESLFFGYDGQTDYFNGKLANVAIYKGTALTQTQIQELMFVEKYSGLSADLKTNLVSWYDLGDTSLGSELVDEDARTFDGTGTHSWAIYGSNTISNVDNNLVVTYVSDDRGAKLVLSDANDLNSDLTTGIKYQVTMNVKINTGDAVIRVYNGANYESIGTIDSTSFTDVTGTFTAQGGTRTLNFDNMGTGEIITVNEFSIKEIQVPDLEGTNEGSNGATTNTGYTHSPHGVVDPLNFGEVYSGRALSFDGINDGVTFGQVDLTNEFTISAFVWWDIHGTDMYLGRSGGDNKLGTLGTSNMFFRITSGGSSDTSITPPPTGQWHHVVLKRDSSDKIDLYINGVKSRLFSDSAQAGTSSWGLLGVETNGTQRHDGKINNVKIFDTDLSDDQVRQLYTKPETVLPTGVSASNLKLDLPMQEGSGSYVYDGSGNQNHGTISGATWVSGEEYGYQASLVRSNTPMVFDDSDDFVTLSDSSALTFGTNDFTLSTWIYINDLDNDLGVVGGETNSFGMAIKTSGALRATKVNIVGESDSTSTVSVNTWHHIAYTRDYSTSTGTYYIDGVASGTTVDNNDYTVVSKYIGRAGASTVLFDGIINEVAYWDVVLDADAVSALYGSGTPLLPTSDSGNYDNSDSLVGYWRNDGNTTWTDRANTGVASFDATDDYLDCGVVTDYSSASGSIATWIKVKDNASPSLQGIVTNGSTGTDSHYVGISSNKVRYTTSNSSIGYTIFSDSDVSENQWVHAVATRSYDGVNTTTKLYIDGVLQADSDTYAGSQEANSNNILIGHLNVSRFFNGQIAGTHIFNVALSASEVSELYAIDKRSSISGFSQFTNCTASWLMGADENDTASTIQDQTSNNHDATVNGAGLVGYNDGTASNLPVEILIPEGSTEGRDNQGYYLSDTTTISNGARFHGSEYIKLDLSQTLNFGTTNFSAECWSKKSVLDDFLYLIKWGHSSDPRWYMRHKNDGKLTIAVDDGTTAIGADSSSAVLDNDWHHYAFTFDRTSSTGLKIYIDGSLDSSHDFSSFSSSDLTNNTYSVWIGVSESESAYYMNGLIDEVRIYNKELSADEVSKNYNNGKTSHQ